MTPQLDPAALYPWLFWAHVTLVTSSATLFLVRCLAVIAGQPWPLRKAWRMLSVAIDTALLSAGATLWWLLQLNPLRDTWLGLKLALLLVYIVLGYMALKRARTTAARLAYLAAALGCLLYMVGAAIAHHPLGWFVLT